MSGNGADVSSPPLCERWCLSPWSGPVTPTGVGLGFDPPQFLRAGDVVELGLDGLGVQKQVCR